MLADTCRCRAAPGAACPSSAGERCGLQTRSGPPTCAAGSASRPPGCRPRRGLEGGLPCAGSEDDAPPRQLCHVKVVHRPTRPPRAAVAIARPTRTRTSPRTSGHRPAAGSTGMRKPDRGLELVAGGRARQLASSASVTSSTLYVFSACTAPEGSSASRRPRRDDATLVRDRAIDTRGWADARGRPSSPEVARTAGEHAAAMAVVEQGERRATHRTTASRPRDRASVVPLPPPRRRGQVFQRRFASAAAIVFVPAHDLREPLCMRRGSFGTRRSSLM